MNRETLPCPLLNQSIASQHCLEITYAAEGRISQKDVMEVADWEKAKNVCADCVYAYWNRNNMEPPFPIESDTQI
jgi:hypothetical protein